MTVQKARLILGAEAKKFTDEDILEIISILDVFVKGFMRSMESEILKKKSSNKNSVTVKL
jgi:hypothetical protein